MTHQRWCIYVDILGFSALWEQEQIKALRSLRELMRAIHLIGTKVYSNEGERLFAHQMGDGFAIASEFGETSLERPIAIAITLMRNVVSTGVFAAAAIAEGDQADITGCYPQEVTDGLDNGHVAKLGSGVMTLSSVMGTAFIRAYRLNVNAPPGPLLIVSERYRDQVPSSLSLRTTKSMKGEPLLSIDWVRADTALLRDIQERAGMEAPTPGKLVNAIKDYFVPYEHMRERWSNSLRNLLDIRV